VNCLAVRERLPEYALSSLGPRDAAGIARHLDWCAACRKESSELDEAAATFAFAAAPEPPPPELEDRIVGAVGRRARRQSASHRRLRRASALAIAAAIVAIVVSASTLWWGTVVARHEDPATSRSDIAQQRANAEHQFEAFIASVPFRRPGDQARFAALAPRGQRSGRGWGFVMLSTVGRDLAGVSVVGLATATASAPYRVWVHDGHGGGVLLGKIAAVDQSGSADMFRRVDLDLAGAKTFVVRDARGALVLRGPIVPDAS
jgi:nitroreductase